MEDKRYIENKSKNQTLIIMDITDYKNLYRAARMLDEAVDKKTRYIIVSHIKTVTTDSTIQKSMRIVCVLSPFSLNLTMF